MEDYLRTLEHFHLLEMRVSGHHQAVFEVLNLLESALNFQDRSRTHVLIAPTSCFGSRVLGQYFKRTRHIELCLSGEYLAITALHEVGHSLDHLENGDFASESRLPNWTEAVVTNPALERLSQSILEGNVQQSLSSVPELFARSFEQWFAQRFLSESMLDTQWLSYLKQKQLKEGSYWTQKEFSTIADALEVDLPALGIQISRPANTKLTRAKRVKDIN